MSLILRAAMVTDRGLVRGTNEDTGYVGARLIAVADGVGGAPAGEVASEIAIGALAPLDHPAPLAEGEPPMPPLAALLGAIRQARGRISAAIEAEPTRTGMGTTLTALLLAGDEMALVHLGDSRAYLWRAGSLSQITRDDTYVQHLVDQGVLTPAEARVSPHRSLVTRVLHGDPVDPATVVFEPQVGDLFLVCSDGLCDVVPDVAIARTMAEHPDPPTCAKHLVALALAGGGPDNVTVVVAEVATEPS